METQTTEEIKQEKQKIFISTKIHKNNHWNQQDDKLLIQLAMKYNEKSWTKVALFFKDKNPAQCRARYKRIRPGIVKGPWSREEDQLIISLVEKFGKNWSLISRLVPTRNGKQIRDRFINYLDPEINKEKFAEEEDEKIIKSYLINGTKWSVIAKEFEGRTGDMIKNRFYSCLRKKVHGYEAKKIVKRQKKAGDCYQIEPITASQVIHKDIGIGMNLPSHNNYNNYGCLYNGVYQMANYSYLDNYAANIISNVNSVCNNFLAHQLLNDMISINNNIC